MARKLRIAVSVFCGLLTVTICVLCVRSYLTTDSAELPSIFGCLSFYSGQGIVYPMWHSSSPDDGWEWKSLTVTIERPQRIWDCWYSSKGYWSGAIPYWTVAIAAALISAAPWLPLRRFSLRTLLIATTLVAVALGLMVWAAG